MFLTAMLSAAVLFPPQDAAAEKDPAQALFERVTKRFAKAPAIQLEAKIQMSISMPGMEEAMDLGTFQIDGQIAKPLHGSLSITGTVAFMGQEQELSMEMVGDGEHVYHVDHVEQTAMKMGSDWKPAFQDAFGLDPLMAWAGNELPAFDEIAFAEADEAHAGMTGLVMTTEGTERVIWLDAKENLKEYRFRSTDPEAMEPSTVTTFQKVAMPEKVDPKTYAGSVPEGYEVMDMEEMMQELEELGYVDGEEEGEEGESPWEAGLLAVGSDAPDVVFTSMEDTTYALSSLRGKTVLMNFWFYH